MTSFLKAFLHFLQMNVISVVFASLCDCVSAWHSAQSNHSLQQGARMETWAFRTCLLPPFSAYMQREIAGCHTTCFPCGIDLKKERGSHAYNAWRSTSRFRVDKILIDSREQIPHGADSMRSRDASPRENVKKIRRNSRRRQCVLERFWIVGICRR